jgi:ubiquinone/menaquinone biosynthesis C-methylase UbiE
MKNHTTRFTGRADDYAKYRPGYPEQIISLLENKINFDSSKDIADVGCGTGLLSRLFLTNGNLVFGVEPNEEMRIMSEKLLSKFINFISVEGAAEETKLANNSVDVITVGQAFHWFDLKKTKKEFKRVLRKDGDVVIVWNERSGASQFMKELDAILKTLNQEHEEAEKNLVDKNLLSTFYGVEKVSKSSFPNFQMLDLAGLKGRVPGVN